MDQSPAVGVNAYSSAAEASDILFRMHDWRPLYPFTSRHLDLDGLRYHYVDEGTGPTLLLVHGNPTWSFYWREVIRGLRDRYRVIAVDHIGCGLSDKPAPSRYAYRLAQRVGDLGTLVERLDLQGRDAGGARLGRGDRHGGGGRGAGAVRAAGAHEHGRLSRGALPAADPHVPSAGGGADRRAGVQPLRARGAARRRWPSRSG